MQHEGCDYHSCHRGSASHTSSTTPCPHHQSLGQLRLRGQMGAGEEVTTEGCGQDGVPRQQRAFLSLALPAYILRSWSQRTGLLLTWQLAPRASGQSTLLGPHCPTPPGREVEPQGLTGQVCLVEDPPSAPHRLGTSGDRICMQVMCRCALVCMRRQVYQASVCTLMPMCTGHVPAWPATGVNSRVRRGYLCVEGGGKDLWAISWKR